MLKQSVYFLQFMALLPLAYKFNCMRKVSLLRSFVLYLIVQNYYILIITVVDIIHRIYLLLVLWFYMFDKDAVGVIVQGGMLFNVS